MEMTLVGNGPIRPHAYRAPMNMPTELEAVCNAMAAHIMRAPKNTVGRRPIPSEMYGANGYAAREPIF